MSNSNTTEFKKIKFGKFYVIRDGVTVGTARATPYKVTSYDCDLSPEERVALQLKVKKDYM